MTTIVRQGRGAWPKDGRGGTLATKTTPGPFYMLSEGLNTVGLAAVLRFLDGQTIPQDELAVHLGVKAIQRLVSRCPGVKTIVPVDGVFGPKTDSGVKEVQKLASLKVDGVVGSKTMESLLLLPVVDATKDRWKAVWGILQYEGGWDPGAVGFADRRDLGLAQVNTVAHPQVTFNEAFDPFWAINFIDNYLLNAAKFLGPDIRDQVASYNLGIGGARKWIAAGRPDVWLPSWSTIERKPNEYIDRILKAHQL